MKRVLFFYLLAQSCLFAIVSITPVDVGEKRPGLSADLMLALSSNRGNSITDAVDTGLKMQFDANRSVTYFMGNYNYGEAKGVTNIDKSFAHLRNIINISEYLDWEFFAQIRSDAFQKLTSRLLLGSGMRLSQEMGASGTLYLGLGGFYAKENVKELPSKEFGRANLYLSYKVPSSELIEFALVMYYQPKVDDFQDFLTLSTAQIDFKINKSFALVVSLSYAYDSQPLSGIQPYDFSYTTSLKYKFK